MTSERLSIASSQLSALASVPEADHDGLDTGHRSVTEQWPAASSLTASELIRPFRTLPPIVNGDWQLTGLTPGNYLSKSFLGRAHWAPATKTQQLRPRTSLIPRSAWSPQGRRSRLSVTGRGWPRAAGRCILRIICAKAGHRASKPTCMRPRRPRENFPGRLGDTNSRLHVLDARKRVEDHVKRGKLMKIKRSPRLITKPARDDWRGQVSQAFVQFWFTEKQNRAVPLVLGEEQSKKRFQERSAASRLLHEELARIKKPIAPQVWAAILQPLDGEVWPSPPFSRPGEPVTIYWENPEASTTFRILTFLKYGVTFRELISKIEASGDVS